MNNHLSLKSVGHATSLFLAITFLICICFDMIFPQHAMFRVWQELLPGFEFTNWKTFIVGLIEAYAYGWYFAVIWVPLYNKFSSNKEEGASCCQ
jgi:cytochrome c biogenesis protein CcdA